jgi:dTDP-4-amino-4,6-dideoxygalactose transaminase
VGYNFRLVELLAEIGIYQLENLEYLNNVRKENYTYLTERLINELGDHLIPQKITHSETYYPYTAAFRWIQGELNIHRDIVAHVLRSEGIPVSNGIPRLMSDNPMFQRQLAFGKDHCPFSCHLYKREGKYTIPEMPNAQRLQEEEYLGFFQIGWPNTRDDMDDIVKGFTRIMDNKDILSHSDLSEVSSYTSGR